MRVGRRGEPGLRRKLFPRTIEKIKEDDEGEENGVCVVKRHWPSKDNWPSSPPLYRPTSSTMSNTTGEDDGEAPVSLMPSKAAALPSSSSEIPAWPSCYRLFHKLKENRQANVAIHGYP